MAQEKDYLSDENLAKIAIVIGRFNQEEKLAGKNEVFASVPYDKTTVEKQLDALDRRGFVRKHKVKSSEENAHSRTGFSVTQEGAKFITDPHGGAQVNEFDVEAFATMVAAKAAEDRIKGKEPKFDNSRLATIFKSTPNLRGPKDKNELILLIKENMKTGFLQKNGSEYTIDGNIYGYGAAGNSVVFWNRVIKIVKQRTALTAAIKKFLKGGSSTASGHAPYSNSTPDYSHYYDINKLADLYYQEIANEVKAYVVPVLKSKDYPISDSMSDLYMNTSFLWMMEPSDDNPDVTAEDLGGDKGIGGQINEIGVSEESLGMLEDEGFTEVPKVINTKTIDINVHVKMGRTGEEYVQDFKEKAGEMFRGYIGADIYKDLVKDKGYNGTGYTIQVPEAVGQYYNAQQSF